MDRNEVGLVLVAARSRLQPVDVGLPAGVRRRVPGLRREEVAALAGISVDYLVRLEQGRGPRPSNQVIDALSRALRLTPDQRDHLYRLSGSEPPSVGRIDGLVRPSTQRIVQRIADLPVMVIDAKGDVVAWNRLALALVGDLSAVPHAERNINRFMFLTPELVERRVVYATPEERDRALNEQVADLRSTAAKYPDDPDLKCLLGDLRVGSADFERRWLAGVVGMRRSSVKTFDHPAVGRLVLDCDAAILPDTDQRLIVYSADPGSAAAAGLELLGVVGVSGDDMASDRTFGEV